MKKNGYIYDIPSTSGTYVLFVHLPLERTIRVGRLGEVRFWPGIYGYVGSAFGPGGLAARIAHHRRVSPAPRWHIDYLRTAAPIVHLWYTLDPVRREHCWAEIISGMKVADSSVPGFGATDCCCPSHLYRFETAPLLQTFRRRVHAAIPGHARIFESRVAG